MSNEFHRREVEPSAFLSTIILPNSSFLFLRVDMKVREWKATSSKETIPMRYHAVDQSSQLKI